MKVLILCLLIGSISAINQSQKDFQEVATSRVSSGCIDRLPRLPSACKNVKVTCSKLKSQCHKTLAQVVKPAGRKCQSKLRKADANKKIYQFCAGSCTTCRDGQWTAWKSTPCTKTCGSDGIQTKTRTCTNPPPTGSGNACDGSSSETIDCELKPCPKPARPTPAPKPKTTPAPKAGISLKEYQKQVDIFRKSIDGLEKKVLSQDALIQGLKQNVSTVKGYVRRGLDTLGDAVVLRCFQDAHCAEPLQFCLNGWCSVVECRNDNQCPEALPYCYGNTCVECAIDSHCTSSSKGHWCNPELNVCECRESLPPDCGWDEHCEVYGDRRCHSSNINGYSYRMDSFCIGNDIASYYTLEAATSSCNSNQICGCVYGARCNGKGYIIREGTSTRTSSGECSWVKR